MHPSFGSESDALHFQLVRPSPELRSPLVTAIERAGGTVPVESREGDGAAVHDMAAARPRLAAWAVVIPNATAGCGESLRILCEKPAE